MGKIVSLKDYMDRETIKKFENVKLPKVYNIRIEMSHDGTADEYELVYSVSNRQVRETITGKEMMFEHLIAIIMSMCADDPMLILELEQNLEAFLFEGDE